MLDLYNKYRNILLQSGDSNFVETWSGAIFLHLFPCSPATE